MLITGLILLGVGSVGVLGAVVMEIRTREPMYMLFMKVFPWLIGLGGVLVGIGA